MTTTFTQAGAASDWQPERPHEETGIFIMADHLCRKNGTPEQTKKDERLRTHEK